MRCQLPKGAFYAFPNVGEAIGRLGAVAAYDALPPEVQRDSSPATLFQLFLLHEHKVAVMDRRSFSTLGSEGQHFLRISTANSDAELAQAVERIARASQDARGFERFLRSGVRLSL